MVYQLSEQLDHIGNPQYAFDAYKEYLKTNRNRFPQSVLDIIDSQNWYGGSGSKALYYCTLNKLELIDYGQSTAQLILTLSKIEDRDLEGIPFTLKLIYQGVTELNIPHQEHVSINVLKCRYNEFEFFDPWRKYQSNEKMFSHYIDWIGQNVWKITAKELHAIWTEIHE